MSAFTRWTLPLLTCAALLVPLGGGAITAQEAATITPRLKADVLQRFRVLVIREGVVLTPRRGPAKSVEIAGGAIAVDGAPVTGRELRQALGDDADLVVQLSYASADALRAAFGPPGGAAPSGSPESSAEGQSPPAASAPATPGEPAEATPETPSAPETPAAPAAPEPHRRKSSAKVHIFGDITVAEDELVLDPVVAIGGSVEVLGRVEDDVVAIGGGVRLGPHAVVTGSVTSVGGRIDQAPGAEIRGDVNEIGVAHGPVQFGPVHWWARDFFGGWFRLFGTVLRIALVLLLALVVAIAAPVPVQRIANRAGDEPWLSGFVGLAAQVAFVPILVITVIVLAITIIGIPLLLLVPFALLALLFGVLMGFVGAAQRVGVWAVGPQRNPLVATAVGVVLVAAGTILARLVWLLPGPVMPIAIIVSLIGFFLEYVAWTVGLGAMLLTRFGTRGRRDPGAAPVYVPPVPPPPVVSDLPVPE